MLQPELENVWLGEVERILNQGRVEGDAKEELRVSVKDELKEQAVQAEKQRSIAKFQIWCVSVRQQIDTYSADLRTRTARHKRIAHILIPMIIVLQWILRIPMILMAYLNRLFEAWLQQKLTALQVNADKYAS